MTYSDFLVLANAELPGIFSFLCCLYHISLISPTTLRHPRICFLILETEEGRKREGEREGGWGGVGRGGDNEREKERKERERGERGRENWTHNLGTCPDWSLNPQPFGEQDDTPTN